MTRRARTYAAVASAIATIVLASGCSSSGDDSMSEGPSGAAPSAGVAHARSQIAKYADATSTFSAPGKPITGLAALKSRKIVYIPIFLQASYYQIAQAQVTEAARSVGLDVEVCDGKATPTNVAACIKQAISSRAVGIITDAIPYAFASTAFADAAAAKIPVVASGIEDQVPSSLAGKAVTRSLQQRLVGSLVADEVIADSNGKANVLVTAATDSTTTKEHAQAMVEEFARHCPSCKVHKVTFLNTSLDKLPTAVSVELTKDPGIDYVISQYDEPAGPLVIQGIKQVPAASKAKLVATSGVLAALKRVSEGQQFADVGSDAAAASWNAVDTLLRLATGASVPPASKYPVLIRAFDKKTVEGLALTQPAANTGQWFSVGTFRSVYKKLWSSAGS